MCDNTMPDTAIQCGSQAASRLAWKQEKFGVDSEEGKTIERSTHLAGQYGRAAGRAVAKRNTLRNEKSTVHQSCHSGWVEPACL